MLFPFEIEHKQILEYLYDNNNDYTTSAILANIIGYSTKTVSKFITEISDELIKNGGEIISKRGHGYRLEINDLDKFNSFLESNILNKQVKHIDEYKQSVHIIIREFLSHTNLKTNHFTEMFFTNRNIISNMYNEVAKSLMKFNIKMDHLSSKGISLSGKEIDIRSAIVYERYYFVNKTINVKEKYESKYCNKEEIKRIKNIIVETQMKFNVSLLDDNSLHDLAFHLYIANLRNIEKKILQFDEDIIDRFTDRNSYYISDTLINELNSKHGYNLLEAEKIFSSIFFVANRTFLSKEEYPISEGYNDCLILTEKIINYLSDVNHFVQIRDDQELKTDLSLNITQLIAQSEFHLYRPIIIKPSTQSLQATLMSVQIANYLYDSYNFKLTEWQLYYLSTIIYPVFGRYHFTRTKGKAIIVSNLNKFAAKSIRERILRNFPNEFSKIEILNLYELAKVDLNNYEYIFSSYTKKELPDLPDNIVYFYTDTFFDIYQKQLIRRKLVRKNVVINNTLHEKMENIKIKYFTDIEDFEHLIKEFSILNQDELSNKQDLIDGLMKYNAIDDFPVKFNTMFLTPLKSNSKQVYISVIVVLNGLKVKDDKVNIFVLWDRGNQTNFNNYFENESLPTILYNVFVDHEVVVSLMEQRIDKLILQKTIEIQEAIIENGASFR